MKFALLLHLDESAWPTMTAEQQQQGLAAYRAYTEALSAAGALHTTGRLRPASASTTVRITNGKTQVLDGPYTDAKEQVGGLYLIEAKDLDAALAWAARCPAASHGVVEVRPLWE